MHGRTNQDGTAQIDPFANGNPAVGRTRPKTGKSMAAKSSVPKSFGANNLLILSKLMKQTFGSRSVSQFRRWTPHNAALVRTIWQRSYWL
jgi:hypothetical protein